MKEVALRTSGEHGTELEPTPTENTVAFRAADFSTLCEALDYSALGQTGCNFYRSQGELCAVLSYTDLREQPWRENEQDSTEALGSNHRDGSGIAHVFASGMPVSCSAGSASAHGGRQARRATQALWGAERPAMAPSGFYPFGRGARV
jgi:hypothetical protein